jgi:hypothetical protein
LCDGWSWLNRRSVVADIVHLVLLMAALALAGGYAGVLFVRYRHQARDYPDQRQWPGQSIDLTRLAGGVRRARNDPVAEIRSRGHGGGRRTRLLSAMKKTVCGLSYWRRCAFPPPGQATNEATPSEKPAPPARRQELADSAGGEDGGGGLTS